MDYSQFYRDWLQLDVPSGETPTLYQLLKLENAEPNLRKIESAIIQTLNHLQNVNGMEHPEIYGYFFHQIQEARRILQNPRLKYEYDLQIMANSTHQVWQSYFRPTLRERFRQMALIMVGLVLGVLVMFVMAQMVERNPDGSIIFHEEAKVKKAAPFTIPVETVVFRPEVASDFQKEGYLVELDSKQSKDAPKSENSMQEEKTLQVQTEKTNEFESLLPDGESEASTPISNSVASDEIAALLPDGTNSTVPTSTENGNSQSPVTTENSDVIAALLPDEMLDSNPVSNPGNASEPQDSTRVNPIYGRFPKQEVTLNEEKQEAVQESEDSETEPEVNSVAEAETSEPSTEFSVTEMPSTQETPAETLVSAAVTFSPGKMLEMLENVRKNMNSERPEAEELFVMLQAQTCNEIAVKCMESSVVLQPDEVSQFVKYTLDTATNLGWLKHFEEAYNLCAKLTELGEKRGFSQNLLDVIRNQREIIEKYQGHYNEAQETLVKLKDSPDDAELNTRYAMWLWQENNSIQESISYLTRCKFPVIRQAAVFEQRILGDERLNTPEYQLKLADLWWEVALRIKNKKHQILVQEHACKYYSKVDSSLLSDEQRLRIAAITGKTE